MARQSQSNAYVTQLYFDKTNGETFWVDILLIGGMSVGKSTLLNAMFGDFVAATGIDRTTTTYHQYFESCEQETNANIVKNTKEANKKQVDEGMCCIRLKLFQSSTNEIVILISHI